MKKKLVCLTLALVITVSQVAGVAATREDELRQEQAETSDQLDNAYGRIDQLQAEKEALRAEIDQLNQSLVDVMVQIQVLETDIANLEKQIEQTKADLKKAEGQRDDQYAAMKKRIQYLYQEGGDTAWFQMLLDAKDISQLLNKAEYTQNMYDYDRKCLNEYVDTVKKIQELNKQLASQLEDQKSMKASLEEQQAQLQAQMDEKKATEEDYEYQISVAQEQANAYAQLLQEQTAEIARLEEERRIAEEAAAAQAAAEAAAAQAAAEAQAAQQEAWSQGDGEEYSQEESYDQEADYDGEPTYDNSGEVENYGSSEDGSSDYTAPASTGYSSSGGGQSVVDYATQFVGNPYVWGGTSLTNGADCSGFVQSVYANFGVNLGRTTYEQLNDGVEVSYSDAQPGDIIDYGEHVAIYMGDGKIVHASNARDGIKISDNAAYRTIVSVRRVL